MATSAQQHELPRWESIELLRHTPIGRLCIVDQGCPIAVPVNYAVSGAGDDCQMVIRTNPNTMIGRYEGPASLEVDEIHLQDGHAWSVIVRGDLRKVFGAHNLPNPEPIITEGRHQWLVLRPVAVSGRRFVISVSDDGSFIEWGRRPAG
jgi:Pyridoxamine 5'-phosphate oxidase